ncbi:MAG: hypothetical protein WA005_16305 [Candidatus Binataceae bacterium]
MKTSLISLDVPVRESDGIDEFPRKRRDDALPDGSAPDVREDAGQLKHAWAIFSVMMVLMITTR